ncbi:MarR family winged helix-turn-helix transcriptional regulator [Nicoliella spurrieriana]|uniref:MarR family winged helix-turn-helix transcriptional regulator n=1 Tax=Nicoliella spurrieriana TaxID=2925830 RepID=A0A976RSP6_9LACO|nr:MarR family winged helix-turn-helix transcriptional regulator [Nicoliella spurrieriana]UQS86886.1 MarR family winged helix-turn-helix transcriptional regulator [Nicoliella spurrieriana]
MDNSQKVITLIGQILEQDSKDDNEKEWMRQNAPTKEVANVIHKLTTRDFHVIIAIYHSQKAYAKALPEQVHISQPTVSRAIKALNDRGLIKRYSTPQNSKDIIVELTPLGTAVAKVQLQLRNKLTADVSKILGQLSEHEADLFVDTLRQIKNLNIFD